MGHIPGDATVSELEAGVAGILVRPDNAGYDDARRIWSAAIDRRPALIVRAAGTDDVVRAVCFAASEGLPIAVRAAAQRGGVLDMRRRDRDRPLRYDRCRSRRFGSPCESRWRHDVGDLRRRDPGPRAGHHPGA